MNPLLMNFLLSLTPGLLASLGGDPQKRMRDELAKLYAPGNVIRTSEQFTKSLAGSPDYMAARNYAVQSSNAVRGGMESRLGALGLDSTGVGAIANSVAGSGLGVNLGRIDADLLNRAREQAMALIERQAGALTSVPYGQSRFQSGLGAGLNAFIPFLRDYMLKMKKPGMGTTNAPQMDEIAAMIRQMAGGLH